MFILLLIWALIGIAIAWLVAKKGGGSAGLPLAYFLGLSLIHTPGALLYLDGDDFSLMATATRVGFNETIIGMAAFLGGVIIAGYAFELHPAQQAADTSVRDSDLRRLSALNRLALAYLCTGCVAFFVVMPIVAGIGTLTAVIASLGSLMLIGVCLQNWVATKTGKRSWFAIILVPLMPLATLLQGGFIGFGTFWALAIVAFLFSQSKRRAIYVFATPIFLFAGISLFVNYMAARGEIRELVWYEQAGLSAKLERVATVFRDFEWLDLSNSRHHDAIANRLNQNHLVGAAVERLESGQVEYAYGSSVGKMVLALIPRLVWPDKPQVGGGGSIVRDFTGIEFGDSTSVGAGQVLEFYVNFGTWGVIGGFLLYGYLIGRMDLLVMRYLRQGDQRRFLFWFMICLSLLDAGGNLLAIVVTAASSAITAYGVGRFLQRRRDVGSLSRVPINHI
jgi:hypothetical protein